VNLNSHNGRGQGIVAADLNLDGAIDIYLGNDIQANFLFMNRDGRFEDVSELSGVSYDYQGGMQAGMGVNVADVDEDDRPDLFVTNFQREHNAFYHNIGDGLFMEVAHRRGLAAASLPWVGWGNAFADFDLDGWLDLIVTNGHVDDNRHLLGETTPYAEPTLLWRNVKGQFIPVQSQAGSFFSESHVGRGLIEVDLDNDGDQDVVITHIDGRPGLLRNNRVQASSSPPPRTLLRLVGRLANRDSIGARIEWFDGQQMRHRQIRGGGSYLSAPDLRQVVTHTEHGRPLQITIHWPGDTNTQVIDLVAGKSYTVVQPDHEGGIASQVVFQDLVP
jgi:hypothetical protein